MDKSLTRYVRISIIAAIVTISLKMIAWLATGSVGLLSDALESFINLLAAVIAFALLKIAEQPPDKEHAFGHSKAEYFSSILEGVFIIVAAFGISATAISRLLHPQPLEQIYAGLAVSIAASAINLYTARILLKAGKKFRSITLEADGHHLMTDVWTSVGVIAGVLIVKITGILIIDPIIALLVAANIVYTGYSIMKRSTAGLMDSSLPQSEIRIIKEIMQKYCRDGISFHNLQTRQSGSQSFMSAHILVPDNWSVKKGHDLLEELEEELRQSIPGLNIATHLEPKDDPRSMER